MKPIILTLFLLLQGVFALAQASDAILGNWQSGHGSGRIQIYKRGDHFFGKIIWLKEPNDESGKAKRDINNPNKAVQSQPIIGLEILKEFVYKGNGIWSNGKIYDPKSGNTYNGQMTIDGENNLKIRAYFGLTLLGKTETWTRVD